MIKCNQYATVTHRNNNCFARISKLFFLTKKSCNTSREENLNIEDEPITYVLKLTSLYLLFHHMAFHVSINEFCLVNNLCRDNMWTEIMVPKSCMSAIT